MKIKSFKQFLNEFELEGEHHQGKPLWNGIDYLTSGGSIELSNMDLTELPCIFPEKWYGSFWCDGNKLTTLEGAPKIVHGRFVCYNNELITLEGAPKEVGGDFDCSHNELTTLEKAPKIVHDTFDCSHNRTRFTKPYVESMSNVNGQIFV
jgi:hypothetical protein